MGEKHYAMLATFITKHNHTVVIISFVKLKSSEIHPSSAAYFLIDLKFRDTPIMKDEVFGIAHAIG